MGDALAKLRLRLLWVYLLLLFAYILTSWIRPAVPTVAEPRSGSSTTSATRTCAIFSFLPPLGRSTSADGRDLRPPDRSERARVPPRAALGRGRRWRSHPSRSATFGSAAAWAAASGRPSTACSSRSQRASRTSGATGRPRRQGRAARARPRPPQGARRALRTTLVSAESAAQQLREQARKEAETIVGEAHAEARAIARRAASGEGTARDGAAPDQVAAPLRARQPRRGVGRRARARRRANGRNPPLDLVVRPVRRRDYPSRSWLAHDQIAAARRARRAGSRRRRPARRPGRYASPLRPSAGRQTTPSSSPPRPSPFRART